jgi:hypothetical protein
MDRDMVNCLHYLYQWGEITPEQLFENDPVKRIFWCNADTRYPLTSQEIVRQDSQTGKLELERGVFNLIEMIENQLRKMPKPDFAFGYPISAALREPGGKRMAFLAISYAAEFDNIKKTVAEAAGNENFGCEVTGDLGTPGNIMEQVWQGIRGADVIVADITGHNPNVFYEIGLAHALGKEVIIISQEEASPFDIQSSRRITYNPAEPEELKTLLEAAFRAVSPRYPFEGPEPRF